MIHLLTGYNFTSLDANKLAPCEACIQEEIIKRPSQWQLPAEMPHPLQGDICRPINLFLGQFKYFMVLIDAYGSHLELALLTTRNFVIPRILATLL